MKVQRFWLILFLAFIYLNTKGQGFSLVTDNDYIASNYNYILVENDTITLMGYCYDGSSPDWGIYIQKVDTFGNILFNKPYYVNGKYFWTATYNNGFVKLKDNAGYVAIGNFHGEQAGYIIRWDHEGNVLFYKEYPKITPYRTNYWVYIEEVNGGFIAAVSRQLADYTVRYYATKLDYEGNVLWETEMGTPGMNNLIRDLVVIDENQYLLTGVTVTPGTADPSNSVTAPQFYAVDSLGTLLWNWEGVLGTNEGGASGVQHLVNGDWLYATASRHFNSMYQQWFRQYKIVRRSANFDLIWEQEYGNLTWSGYSLQFYDLKPYQSDGYIAVGSQGNADEIEKGYVVKTDLNGNLIWERHDSAWTNVVVQNNKWVAVDMLASGSIIVCGTSTDNSKTWAWLMKLSPDGCVDTLNCVAVPTHPEPSAPEWATTIYPNPATNNITISANDIIQNCRLVNSIGETVWSGSSSTNQLVADVKSLASGIYFCYLDVGGGGSFIKKVIIQH